MSIKALLKRNVKLRNFAAFLYSFARNRKNIRGVDNHIDRANAFMSGCKIRIYGSHNRLIFNSNGVNFLKNIIVSIHGNNNVIILGSNVSTQNLSFCIEDDNNRIELGDNFQGGGFSELAAIEGTEIIFGKSCMLSAYITVRTGDSHSILNATTKERINDSQSVIFGDHVWIGNTVLIFKGAKVASNSIIAGGSVVTGKSFPPNCIIGGNPAKVIKENVDWIVERI